MKEYKGHTSIHFFYTPFTKRMVYKSLNNRFPLSGRKVKKLVEKIKNKYPDAVRVEIHVHHPIGAYNWAFLDKPVTKQSVYIIL